MTDPVRMPGGIFDYFERGHTASYEAEVIAAEAASHRGDPRTYERELERQASRPPAVQMTGKGPTRMISDALGMTEPDDKEAAD